MSVGVGEKTLLDDLGGLIVTGNADGRTGTGRLYLHVGPGRGLRGGGATLGTCGAGTCGTTNRSCTCGTSTAALCDCTTNCPVTTSGGNHGTKMKQGPGL